MIDVWQASEKELKQLAPGTRVFAGDKNDPNSRGIWCGMTKNGTSVVAWHGNYANKPYPEQVKYIHSLMKYAER